jgi:hypothetical protein
MPDKTLFRYGFSWKIFDRKAQVGDRMTFQPPKKITNGGEHTFYQFIKKLKIYGKEVQFNDKVLQIAKHQGVDQPAMMAEDAEGVFIFLPKPDSVFYEGMDQDKVLEYTESINSTLKKLADLSKELEENQKNMS